MVLKQSETPKNEVRVNMLKNQYLDTPCPCCGSPQLFENKKTPLGQQKLKTQRRIKCASCKRGFTTMEKISTFTKEVFTIGN